MSMWLILGYLALVIFLTYALTVVVAIVLGVMDARAYYRVNPDAVPPDKFLVRLCLRGVR